MEAIHQFFAEKKAEWLKDKIKSIRTDEDRETLEQQANERFDLVNWLPDAAKRASQISIVSHPSKFSHPSAKTTAIIAKAVSNVDGYLRTGNLEYPLDAIGAAAMDVYKFLNLPLDDNRTVFEHIERDTAKAKSLLNISTSSYETLKEGFLAVKQSAGNKTYSDRLVKQVYFPLKNNEYHLLSLLTPSGIIKKFKNAIDEIHFSEKTKEARECRKNGLSHATGYDDVLDLTVTGFGGAQPQNVSVINSENRGKAYLLISAPPTIEKRALRLPTSDFFTQTLRSWPFKEPMHELHKFMKLDINNIKIRAAISNTIIYMVRMVVQEATVLRNTEVGWSTKAHYQNLEVNQRIWLDDAYATERLEQPEWVMPLSRQFARWFLATYKKVLSADAFTLGDQELFHVESFIIETLEADEELLK